jgi:hypothetical protein
MRGGSALAVGNDCDSDALGADALGADALGAADGDGSGCAACSRQLRPSSVHAHTNDHDSAEIPSGTR